MTVKSESIWGVKHSVCICGTVIRVVTVVD